jgi:hypothetical protein
MPWLLRWLRRLLDPEDRSWPEGSYRQQLQAFAKKSDALRAMDKATDTPRGGIWD